MARLINFVLVIILALVSHAAGFPGARIAHQGMGGGAMPSGPPTLHDAGLGSFKSAVNTTALTLAYTVAADCTNCILLVAACSSRTATPTATLTATYNGTAMTSVASETTQFRASANMFYMLDAALVTQGKGVSHTISVATSGNNSMALTAFTVKNVNQATPFGTPTTNVGSLNNQPTASVTTSMDELVISDVCWYFTVGDTLSVDSPSTQIANQLSDVTNRAASGSSYNTGSSPLSMDWTINAPGSRYWSMVGVSIKP